VYPSKKTTMINIGPISSKYNPV